MFLNNYVQTRRMTHLVKRLPSKHRAWVQSPYKNAKCGGTCFSHHTREEETVESQGLRVQLT